MQVYIKSVEKHKTPRVRSSLRLPRRAPRRKTPEETALEQCPNIKSLSLCTGKKTSHKLQKKHPLALFHMEIDLEMNRKCLRNLSL